jgi:hypothetical protein
MPCRSDYMEPTPAEREAPLRKELDRLTAENDRLREIIIAVVEGTPIKPSDLKWVATEQVAHRKDDLARLEKTFREALTKNPPKKTADVLHLRLGRVVTADPTKSLESQLGFDPDSV